MNELPIIIAGISCMIAGLLLFWFTKGNRKRPLSTAIRHPSSKRPGVWAWIEKIERQKLSRRAYIDTASLSQAEKALLAKTSGRLGKLAACVLIVLGFVFLCSLSRTTGHQPVQSGHKAIPRQQAYTKHPESPVSIVFLNEPVALQTPCL